MKKPIAAKDKLTDNEFAKLVDEMKVASFANEHGEKFNVHYNGVIVFLSGHEVNAMVRDEDKLAGKYLPLFNSHFDVWSADELKKLGQALIEVSGG